MDMPGYADYGKMFDMPPAAFGMALNQLEQAKQSQQTKMAQDRAALEASELQNMFNRQNNPHRVEASRLANEGAAFDNRTKGVNTRIAEQTEGSRLTAEQAEYVRKASKAELDGLEYAAQRMAYSPDPQQREAGLKLMRLHKDFVKMRDEQTYQSAEKAKDRSHAFALEGQRHKNATERATTLAKAKSDAAQGTDKMSVDQRISHYTEKAREARAAGNYELANEFYRDVEYLTQMKAMQRPDTGAGKIDAGAVSGLPTVPPRPMPTPPVAQERPTPALTPNQGHIDFLRKNPQLAGEFDTKFGAGASAKILGTK